METQKSTFETSSFCSNEALHTNYDIYPLPNVFRYNFTPSVDPSTTNQSVRLLHHTHQNTCSTQSCSTFQVLQVSQKKAKKMGSQFVREKHVGKTHRVLCLPIKNGKLAKFHDFGSCSTTSDECWQIYSISLLIKNIKKKQ